MQIINNESIFCGQILSNAGARCLVHTSLSGPNLTLTVRTASLPVTEAVIRHAAILLK